MEGDIELTGNSVRCGDRLVFIILFSLKMVYKEKKNNITHVMIKAKMDLVYVGQDLVR